MEHSFGHTAHPVLQSAFPVGSHGNCITAAEHLRPFTACAILGNSNDAPGNIVIPVIIIVYLLADRNVREAFRT